MFSTIRGQRARIPQEADHRHLLRRRVGCRDPGDEQGDVEGEHLKDMLVGNILAVSWPEVLEDGGAVRRRSASSTTSSGSSSWPSRWTTTRAEAQGSRSRFWDFLFYASFGFVVTSSVSIAGVLLVFCYLIVPSVAAMLYAGSHRARGWRSAGRWGRSCRRSGVYLSLALDLPTGATIVCTFGIVLALMAAVRCSSSATAPGMCTSATTPTWRTGRPWVHESMGP